MRQLFVAALLMSGGTVWAADYLTEGVDNARTGWMKNEKIFNTTNVKDMKLLWKIKLESTPREMHNLFSPLIVERVTTPNGTREMAVVAGVSDDLFGIDVVSGEQMWRTHFDSTYTPPAGGRGGGTLCPGGQTAVPVIAPTSTPGKYTIYAVSWDGRMRQLNLADGQEIAPAEKFMPSNGKPYALNLYKGTIYTASAQGCGGVANAFYSYDIATRKSSVFLPAGGGMWGRRGAAVSPEGVVYIGTGDGQYNPTTRSLGNSLVAVKLDDKQQLQMADYFAPPDANWLWRRDLDVNTTPIAFDYKGKKFLVGTSKQCKMWLLDRDTLGGEDHRTSLYTTPLLCNDDAAFDGRGVWGAMAAWQDSAGAQWLAVPFWGPVSREFHAPIENARPTHGGVGAYKVEQKGAKWQLTPAWLSVDMDLAEEVTIANGVAFAYGGGEDASQTVPDLAWNEPGGPRLGGGLDSSATRRIPNSRHATLFALDAATGKQLWSSGNQITSWNHFSGLTVANGRAYLATFDGTLYCFGVAK
jgi:outer membrane protein assembly factor BamB